MFRQGAQGAYDGASNGILESEFGTSVDDEVIKQILEKGTLQESQVCLLLSWAGPPSLIGGLVGIPWTAYANPSPRRCPSATHQGTMPTVLW